MEKVKKFTDNEINESSSHINNLMNALLEINSSICMEMSKFSSDRAVLVCGTDAMLKISDALLETEKFYNTIMNKGRTTPTNQKSLNNQK